MEKIYYLCKQNNRTMPRTRANNSPAEAKVATKVVHNRNGYKIELIVNDIVAVILPGKSIEVPMDYVVPAGIGLYVVSH